MPLGTATELLGALTAVVSLLALTPVGPLLLAALMSPPLGLLVTSGAAAAGRAPTPLRAHLPRPARPSRCGRRRARFCGVMFMGGYVGGVGWVVGRVRVWV